MKRVFKIGQIVKVKIKDKIYKGEIKVINISDLTVVVDVKRVYIVKLKMNEIIEV